jgi:hypothetical protein
MREAMDLQLWKQRRVEMRREVEQNRLERALRGSPKRSGSVRASSPVREVERFAGPLRKLLRSPRSTRDGKKSSARRPAESFPSSVS